jgi:hypothetical protein
VIDARLREAFEDLDRYLADQVAPLLVADAIEVLLEYPPALTAETLRVWAIGQHRARGGAESLADLLFHAIKKVQLFEEFNLLSERQFTNFVTGVVDELVNRAPENERSALAEMLSYLRSRKGPSSPLVERLHRAGGSRAEAPAPAPQRPAPVLSAEDQRALRRFELFVDRIAPSGPQGDPRVASDEVARQLLVLATAGATSAGELEERLARLQTVGAAPAYSRDLVSRLSEAIPDWLVRREGKVEIVRGESVEAVRRAVKLAGDGARSAERWKDLVRTATDSFNKGAYARAITLFDLADRMAADGEVDARVVEIAHGSATEAIEPTKLLEVAADPDKRPMLRRLVEFFPEWSLRELLDALVFQPDAKRRRVLLALIEAWGAEAYGPVLERLASAAGGGVIDSNAWWYLRNLVYLLHRLPRPDDVDPKQVIELVGPFSALSQPPSFQRETFTLLGQLPSGLGAPLLILRLGEAERALASNDPPPYDDREMGKILSSLAVALVRTGVPAARRALIEHALAQRPRTGDASARLRELGNVDLSSDREALGRLLEAARFLQPKKVLGLVVSRNETVVVDIARALASTTDPGARRLLAELAERFPEREVGRVAAAVISGAAVPHAPRELPAEEDESGEFSPEPESRAAPSQRAALTGDLEVFGLPGLLQSLQQSAASGQLLLRRADGSERARLLLVEGRLSSCSCGELSGEEAFYQVCELPAPGTFEFVREPAAVVASRPKGQEILALLMEGMRRFDEVQRLRALIPAEARVRPGANRPTAPADERGGELVRRLWTASKSGASVTELERISGVDSFRALSLLMHWLEEGAAELELSLAAQEIREEGSPAAG